MEQAAVEKRVAGPRNVNLIAPPGFAELKGEDLYKWQLAKMSVETFKAQTRESEARIREHENGLTASRLQLVADQAALSSANRDLVQVEMALGIEKPEDIKPFGGTFFRRVNGKAKSDAPAPESAAKVTVTDPAAAGAQAAPPAVEPTPAPAAG